MKVLTAFPISDHKRGYRRHECHSCYKERHRSYYADDPKPYKERANKQWDRWGKQAYADLRDEIFEMLGPVCNCCGESEKKFLAIDHVDDDGSQDRKKIGSGLRGLRGIKRQIENGERRYQVLCHNCNHGRYLNGGICPHKEGSTTISQESRAKRPEAHSTLMG